MLAAVLNLNVRRLPTPGFNKGGFRGFHESHSDLPWSEDDHSQSMHVAGIIAAKNGDNKWSAGIAPNANLREESDTLVVAAARK